MTKLNKITSVLLSAIMVIGIFSVIPFAAGAETSGSFRYDVLDDGTASIKKYIDNGSKIVDIPSTIDGYKVTEIGYNAFSGCTGLKSVTIPSSVKEIGDWAFWDCTGLTKITVDKNNKNYTSVDGVLFNKDKTIILVYPSAKGSSYVIPGSVTYIGKNAFSGCTGLKSVIIPNSVKEISSQAFATCTGLKSVTIPNSVTKISWEVFLGCTGLTSATISRSATYIGEGAFYGCTSLKSVTIPSSVTEIGYNAFGYTSNGKISGFTIYGKKGTEAERYANSNGFKFVKGTAPAEPAVPTGVKLNQSSLTLGKGESYTISESTSKGSYANGANLKWISTNTRVATVQKGKGNKAVIKAVGTGTASIKITLFNGKTATCKVTVKPAPTSVKINPIALTLGKGESYTVSESTSKGSYATWNTTVIFSTQIC